MLQTDPPPPPHCKLKPRKTVIYPNWIIHEVNPQFFFLIVKTTGTAGQHFLWKDLMTQFVVFPTTAVILTQTQVSCVWDVLLLPSFQQSFCGNTWKRFLMFWTTNNKTIFVFLKWQQQPAPSLIQSSPFYNHLESRWLSQNLGNDWFHHRAPG